jgi:hypothetical protein
MAFPAQFQNRFKFFVLWCALPLLTVCCGRTNAGETDNIAIPFSYINQADRALLQQQGFLLCNGKKFSGYVIRLSGDGDTLYKCSYWAGKQHGYEKEYHHPKQLARLGCYVHGSKKGTHKGWHENGQLRFESDYQNDVYHGNVKEWYATGLQLSSFNYINGHEAGVQQIWRPDGRLYANYEVRNGRKYGLTGNKNCVTAAETHAEGDKDKLNQ